MKPNSIFIIDVGFGIRMMGPLFIAAFYALLGIHVYSYTEVILFVIKKRLGAGFGMVWIAIGMAILYNIVFNHLAAWLIKPGSPNDLKV